VRGATSALHGLGTRVATRTFLTFALCAITPIALLAFISHQTVRDELRALAVERLAHTSKSYGLLIFERVRQSGELLTRLADAQLRGAGSVQDLRAFSSARVRIVDVRTGADADAVAGMRLLILPGESERSIALSITRTQGDRRITLVGAITPEHLWDADAVQLGDIELCVREASGAALHCEGEPVAEDALTANWSLFLRPVYGADTWTIETKEPQSAALATVRGFSRTLPIAAGLAVGLALLFSVMQIRRSHRPLAVLTEAAAQIGARRVAAPIVLEDRDEYGALALAFNRMGASVSRHFQMMAALARIDRMILANPAIGAVLERTLPELPRLTGSRVAAVLLLQEGASEASLYVSYREEGKRVHSRRMRAGVNELRALLQGDAESDANIEELRRELRQGSRGAALEAAPIRVERRLRGVLLLSRTAETDATRRRHARAFARRFAVALGAQERREALLKQAYYDELTGLPNRQLFKDRLHQELAHARRSGQGLALIYVDLDRFKNVNDSLGHTAGDDLLKLVSWRLGSVMRDADTLARLGGDEFVVIASGARETPAHVVAERLQDAIHGVLRIRDVDCFIEASMGIAVFPQDGTTPEVLLRNADTAMYRAKALGGGRVVYFEETMNRDAMRRMHIEQRLRATLAQGGLTLAYQPQISTADGSLCGVEALARWTDAELGTVSPTEFIPVAEECGLIDQIGDWAIREACATFQTWRSEGWDVGRVSVNVSMRQLRDDRFVDSVRRILEETRMPPGALELEVTESTLAESPRRAMAVLEELRGMGVRIAIDDFGVGYSSMAALGQLPADVLKIDRSFIVNCAARSDASSIVEAIISMAHALGKLTVAEGVEDENQLALLRLLGCDVAQGYLHARPLPAAEVPRFIAARSQAAAPTRADSAPPAAEGEARATA
jgi:diguanylate cyclase (GGDEF)-like protein